jgi:hypothetical protein
VRCLLALAVTLLAACGASPSSGVPSAAPSRSAEPSFQVYWAESGSNLVAGDYVQLPAAVAIDYHVYGSCLFSVRLFAEATPDDNVDTPAITVDVPAGQEVVGSWSLRVKPGRYGVGGGGDGCTWLLSLREDPYQR